MILFHPPVAVSDTMPLFFRWLTFLKPVFMGCCVLCGWGTPSHAEIQVHVDGDAKFLQSSVYQSLLVMFKHRGISIPEQKNAANVVRIWVQNGSHVFFRQATWQQKFSIPDRYQTDVVRARAIVLFLELFQNTKESGQKTQPIDSSPLTSPRHATHTPPVIAPDRPKPKGNQPTRSRKTTPKKRNNTQAAAKNPPQSVAALSQKTNTIPIPTNTNKWPKTNESTKIPPPKANKLPQPTPPKTNEPSPSKTETPVPPDQTLVVTKPPPVRSVAAIAGKPAQTPVKTEIRVATNIREVHTDLRQNVEPPTPQSRRWWLGLEAGGGGGWGIGLDNQFALQGLSSGRAWGQISVIQGPNIRNWPWLSLRLELNAGGMPLREHPSAFVFRSAALVGTFLPLPRLLRLHIEVGGFAEFVSVNLDEGFAARWRGGLQVSLRLDVPVQTWLSLFVASSYLFAPYRATFARRGQLVLQLDHSQMDFVVGLRFYVLP